jgi:hypothetical protein
MRQEAASEHKVESLHSRQSTEEPSLEVDRLQRSVCSGDQDRPPGDALVRRRALADLGIEDYVLASQCTGESEERVEAESEPIRRGRLSVDVMGVGVDSARKVD